MHVTIIRLTNTKWIVSPCTYTCDHACHIWVSPLVSWVQRKTWIGGRYLSIWDCRYVKHWTCLLTQLLENWILLSWLVWWLCMCYSASTRLNLCSWWAFSSLFSPWSCVNSLACQGQLSIWVNTRDDSNNYKLFCSVTTAIANGHRLEFCSEQQWCKYRTLFESLWNELWLFTTYRLIQIQVYLW